MKPRKPQSPGHEETQLHFRASPAPGYTEILRPGMGGISLIRFGILNLAGGETYTEELHDSELYAVILSGTVNVSTGHIAWQRLGERKDVFSGKAAGFRIPQGENVRIQGVGGASLALCRTPGSENQEPRLIRPQEVTIRGIGKANWYREAHDIFTEGGGNRLLIGETFNPPGNWSSYPPHRHEVDDFPAETRMSELYYYRLDPPQGFALQRLYTDDGAIDNAFTIRDGDTVAIPRGYHPVAAAAGYRLYYLWVLAGESGKLRQHDDPAHSWVKTLDVTNP